VLQRVLDGAGDLVGAGLLRTGRLVDVPGGLRQASGELTQVPRPTAGIECPLLSLKERPEDMMQTGCYVKMGEEKRVKDLSIRTDAVNA
jgi:hypothetical protein